MLFFLDILESLNYQNAYLIAIMESNREDIAFELMAKYLEASKLSPSASVRPILIR